MKRAMSLILGMILACALSPLAARASGGRLAMDEGGGGGMDVNLIVREIRATPSRVHPGEPVRIEMVVENHAEGAGTVWARVTANGREVDGHFYTYGWGGEGGRVTKESFTWDTKGIAPGEYRIKGEVYAPEDTSPSDNAMAIPEPVVVLPPDAAESSGGSVVARDPRYHPAGDVVPNRY